MAAHEVIQVAPGGRSFVAVPSGAKFTPSGFNYDHDSSTPSRLLEDYWHTDWPKVVRDIRAMRSLGATVVRIHLQLPRFLRTAEAVDDDEVAQLGRLLRLAETEGVYVDLTGLGDYRPSDVPAWLDALSEEDRWAAQARFWEAIATEAARSRAVFCLNLMNEPAVPDVPQRSWFASPWIDGRTYVEYLVKDPRGRARSTIARQWIRAMTGAIRRHDTRHLVTVGNFTIGDQAENLPIGLSPRELAEEVDFLTLHLYPESAHLDAARRQIEQMKTTKPLLVEESAPLSCSQDEYRGIVAQARADVAGWMGFYWGL